MTRANTACVVLALVAGCGRISPHPLEDEIGSVGSAVVGGHVAFVERATRRAIFVDPLTLARRSARVGRNPVAVAARRGDHRELLVLALGARDTSTAPASPATLTVIDPESLVAREYVLGGSFNRFVQSADGRFAVAFVAAGDTETTLLANPNELATIDLDAAPFETNPQGRTIRTLGGSPLGVEISPPLALSSGRRPLAVAFAGRYLVLIDLERPTLPETVIPIVLPEDRRSLVPGELVFAPESPAVFLRLESATDVVAINLNAVTSPDPAAQDFQPVVNLLAAGAAVSDIAVYDLGEGPRVLAAVPSLGQLRVMDAVSSLVTVLALPAPAETILMFEGAAPGDARVRLRAVAYAEGGRATSSGVTFVDPANLEVLRTRNLETVWLESTTGRSLSLPSRRLLVLEQRTGSSVTGLSVLDLETHSATPIVASVSLTSARATADEQTIWVQPLGVPRLGILDVATLHPEEVRLDEVVSELLFVPTIRGTRVVAIHPGTFGALTVLDEETPARSSARGLTGFLLENVLTGGR